MVIGCEALDSSFAALWSVQAKFLIVEVKVYHKYTGYLQVSLFLCLDQCYPSGYLGSFLPSLLRLLFLVFQGYKPSGMLSLSASLFLPCSGFSSSAKELDLGRFLPEEYFFRRLGSSHPRSPGFRTVYVFHLFPSSWSFRKGNI